MKTKIQVAVIAGIFAIIAAFINHFTPSKSEKSRYLPSSKATQTVNSVQGENGKIEVKGDNNTVIDESIHAGRDANIKR